MDHTERGFSIEKFKDKGNNQCSLQKSSITTEDCVWFGIDNPKLTVFEDNNLGRYVETTLPSNWKVFARMHLTQEQVKQLLPALQKFVKTGKLE